MSVGGPLKLVPRNIWMTEPDPEHRRKGMDAYFEGFRYHGGKTPPTYSYTATSTMLASEGTHTVTINDSAGYDCTCYWARCQQGRGWVCGCSDKKNVHQDGGKHYCKHVPQEWKC